jgi:AcrR family transcriptional regulator
MRFEVDLKIDASNMSRVERKKEETKHKIISVAMKLFIEQGVDNTSMEQVAEEADIAKGTLYNYFPVKEAIIDEYIKRVFLERNPERIARLQTIPDTRSRMTLILGELIEGIQTQKEIFERYFVYRIQNMISLKQDESAQSGLYFLEIEIIELGQKNDEIRKDLPLEILTGLFEFVFIKVAQQFYRDPEHFATSQVIEQCVDLFMNGVGVGTS